MAEVYKDEGPSPTYIDEALVTLTIVDPPPSCDHPVRRILLSKSKTSIVIGRTSKRNANYEASETNAWIDSAVMSRDHAELSLDPERQYVLLRDIGSLHGTFWNHHRFARTGTHRLQDGDVIQFGVPIERGQETFPACFLKANVEFGSKSPENRPVVFRVPDETDLSSDEDLAIDHSSQIIFDNHIRPASQPIDLTENDHQSDDHNGTISVSKPIMPESPEIVDLTGPNVAPSSTQSGSSKSFSSQDSIEHDDDDNSTDSEPRIPTPPETIQVSDEEMENEHEEDEEHEFDDEVEEEEEEEEVEEEEMRGDEEEEDEEGMGEELDMEQDDEDEEEREDEESVMNEALYDPYNEEMEEESCIMPHEDSHHASIWSQTSIHGSAMSMMSGPPPCTSPARDWCLPQANQAPASQSMSQSEDANSFHSAPQYLPRPPVDFGLLRRSPLPPILGGVNSIPLPFGSTHPNNPLRLPSIMSTMPQENMFSAMPSLYTPELVNDRAAKQEFFEAREHNKLNFERMASLNAEQTLPSNLMNPFRKPMGMFQATVGEYDVEKRPMVLQTPEETMQPPSFDAMAETHQDVSAETDAGRNDNGPQFNNKATEEPIHSDGSASSEVNEVHLGEHAQHLRDQLPTESPSHSNSLKRKAEDISEIVEEEEESVEMSDEPLEPMKSADPNLSESMTELSIRHHRHDRDCDRPPKRFRKFAEVFGYAALGGVAVMSALIATAPAL